MEVSSYIQLPEALGFIEAASKAFYKDIPLNCHITLHLERAGISPKNASKNVRESIHRLGKYHKRKGMPICYAWVLENSPVYGTHLHLLLHRPNELPMHYMTYRWAVLKRFKLPNEKGMLKVEKFRTHQSYEINLTTLADYVLKGIRQGTEQMFFERTGLIVGNAEKQGIIYGKRINWSR